MQYSFTTVLGGKLRECTLDSFSNLILVQEKNGGTKVAGRIYYDKQSLYPVAPIFQYTGHKDINFKKIYDGHILESKNGLRFIVRWNEFFSAFELCSYIENEIGEIINFTVLGWELAKELRIVGHRSTIKIERECK